MLVEQIIEFELRGPRLHGCTCNPKTGHYCDNIKIAEANFRVNYYSPLKILQKAMYLIFPYLGQATYKIEPKSARF